jgi:hypothetical protein
MDDTRMWLSSVLSFVMRMTRPGAICRDALVPRMPYMDDFLEGRDQMMECVAQSVCMRIGCDAPPATAVLTKMCGWCELVRYCSKDVRSLLVPSYCALTNNFSCVRDWHGAPRNHRISRSAT